MNLETILKLPASLLALVVVFTFLVYADGLDGPFLFDDHIHITQNKWVKIDSLSIASFAQAWNSSFSAFPSNRPLAQLSFGINHAVAGLDPWAFKTTNLVLHVIIGILVFVFVRLVTRCIDDDTTTKHANTLAIATAMIWLLHPLHVSTVLYTVQRMAQLSTLSLLLALSAYVWGRLQIAQGRSGIGWIIATVPLVTIGFFGKENTVLLPLLLLVCEVTILRNVRLGHRPFQIYAARTLLIALPIIVGIAYLISNPGLINHDGRPFTLEERALTQTRILWHYLWWMFIPDITALGLFHDDIPKSTGLLNPLTTLPAIVGLFVMTIAAILFRKRFPVFAFAALFFLANHALESTILPLEMVFEHRNYLASLGPLFLLTWLVVVASTRMKVRMLAITLGTLLLIAYASATVIRVNNWSSYVSFVLATAENHPNSPRANFLAAQLFISSLQKTTEGRADLAQSAETFLRKGIAVDPQCINCFFGMIVLKLHLDQVPSRDIIRQLTTALRIGDVGPTKLSISQFSYLVKWYRSDGVKLQDGDLEAVFDAALANPRLNRTGRAGIEAAYREYFEFVADDFETALKHAQAAIEAWPQQWGYHMQKIKLLRKLQRYEEALEALGVATTLADNVSKVKQTEEAREKILREMTN